jgi:Gpi18-like mannosyltransferase
VLGIFLLSRLAFYLAAFFGGSPLPQPEVWPGQVDVNAPRLLALHWRWDAIHYYSIATGDYGPELLPAFFPLLPLLIYGVATLLGGLRPPAPVAITAAEPWPLLAGVIVTNVAALLALWLLFVLAREETGDEATARRAVLYTAAFPLAFYYAVPYTEALFLATTLGVFLDARRGRWLRAGLWALAASATRLVGILLLPVLALEIALAWRRGAPRRGERARALGGLLLAPLGLPLFMLHLWRRVGDPLAFLRVQDHWGREQAYPWVALWRGLTYALQPTGAYAHNTLQTAIVLGFLAISVASLRRWRPSYLLYALLLFIVLFSSHLQGPDALRSTGRYLMVLFPVYFTLARWGRHPAVHQLILWLWLPLYGVLSVLYSRWYFVA